MTECKNCRRNVDSENLLTCPNCGATLCKSCAERSKQICPYCYSNLEYMG